VTEAFADTNLFVRLVDRGDVEQAKAAERVFQEAENGDLLLHVTPLVIAEIVWVLTSTFKMTREDIRDFLLSIVVAPGIELEDSDLVLDALTMYSDLNIDYADAYYIAWMRANGVHTVYTFDKKHFTRAGGLKVMTPA